MRWSSHPTAPTITTVPLAWRYRNFVIEAFNADKPYDEFIREQIAGDILAAQGPPEKYAERVTATGYLAISRRFGFDSENYHHLTIQDTIDSLGQSVLGLSLGCARCHDHKFDPISMQDYYALYGIFDSSRYAFPGSEQKQKFRSLAPLAPASESVPKWRAHEQQVAWLTSELTRLKRPVPTAVLRSLTDLDGDFELQAPAAGGSNGVLVPPWLYEGKIAVPILSLTSICPTPGNWYSTGSSMVKILMSGAHVGFEVEKFKDGETKYDAEIEIKSKRKRGFKGNMNLRVNDENDIFLQDIFINKKLEESPREIDFGRFKKRLGLEYQKSERNRLTVGRSFIYKRLEEFTFVGRENILKIGTDREDDEVNYSAAIGYAESNSTDLQLYGSAHSSAAPRTLVTGSYCNGTKSTPSTN